MTYTEKRLEKVCEKNCPDFNGMSILHIEQCQCSCHPVLAKGEISLIHQALAEERERMREKANKLRKDHSFKVHEVGDIAKEAYNQALDDLLSSLDKPEIDKE